MAGVRRHVADRFGRDDWPETLSHEDRRRLLGAYLATSYVEVNADARDAWPTHRAPTPPA